MATSELPTRPIFACPPCGTGLRDLRWRAALTMEQCALALNLSLLEYSDIEKGRQSLTALQQEKLILLLDVKLGHQRQATGSSRTPEPASTFEPACPLEAP